METFNLRVSVYWEYKYYVKTFLFNAADEIVPTNTSNLDQTTYLVPKGLYTLRIEVNGKIKDDVILINKDVGYQIGGTDTSTYSNTKYISLPQQFSSALLSDSDGVSYGSSFEYYTYPAVEWGKKDTFIFNLVDGSDTSSSLFIFLRFPSLEQYKKLKPSLSNSFYSDFELVDETGNGILKFDSDGVIVNEEYGWLAFNAKLPYGIYYLMYRGKESRQVPIYVFKQWQTQFFMTLGREPLFGTIRTFITKERRFNPNETTHKYIDILLNKLQNKDYTLDKELIEMAAHGKYRSPMLGLICSYIYLKSKKKDDDRLFKLIVKNMQDEILKDNTESPDLRALNILASNHFKNHTYEKSPVIGTPMFRIGFETILNASVKNMDLISENSNNDYISENLLYDSPFNTFSPIPAPKDRPITPPSTIRSTLTSEDYSINVKDLLGKRLLNYIQSSERPAINESWVKNSISDIIVNDENVSISKISNNLNISANTVSRIFTEWDNEARQKK